MLRVRRRQNRDPIARFRAHQVRATLLAALIAAACTDSRVAQAESPSSALAQQPVSPPTPTAGQQTTLPDAPAPAQNPSSNQQAKKECNKKPCPAELMDWYKRFANGPQVKPLT